MYPHLEKPGGEPARLKRLPRIRVAQIVMDYLAYGWAAAEICPEHPALAPAEIQAAMAYYYDNRVEIEAEIQSEVKVVEEDRARMGPSAILLQLRAKGLR